MKKLLAFAALSEAATGLAFVVVPSLIARLLFGAEISGLTIALARVGGIGIFSLGVACWPGSTALCGMLTYSVPVTVYLGHIAISGEWVGILLWPAVVLHAILTALLARAWFKKPQEKRLT